MNKALKKKYIVILILFLFPFVLYVPSLRFGLTYMDDNILVANARADGLGKGLSEVFKKDVFSEKDESGKFYRPFLTLSFIADGRVGGEDLFFYHLTNLLLHCFFCVLIFFFFRIFDIGAKASFAGSLFFAAVPCLATAVAWLPGRNDSLLAIFVVSAVITFVKWLRSGKGVWLFLFSVFLISALFTKETSAALPPLLLYLMFSRGQAGRRDFLKFCAAVLIPCFIYLYLRAGADISGTSLSGLSYGSLFYLPALSVDWLFPFFNQKPAGTALLTLAAFFIAFYLVKKSAPNRKRAVFGLLWFYIFLIPPLLGMGLYFSGSFFLSHRFYLPLAGMALALLSVPRPTYFGKNFMRAALALLFCFMCCESFLNCMFFRNEWVFSQYRIKEDDPCASENYADVARFYMDRDLDGIAEKYFRTALAENTVRLRNVHLHLAAIALKRGRLDEMYTELQAELKDNPDNKYASDGLIRLEKAGYKHR